MVKKEDLKSMSPEQLAGLAVAAEAIRKQKLGEQARKEGKHLQY